jgi:metallo-beta-lactamase class B
VRRAFVIACFAIARACLAQPGSEPVAPFRIIGNLYYVGASDICSYLIATPKGLIVIDGGYAEMAPMIRANIGKLGFHLRDVKILLNTHAHLDHAGGLARLKQWTGAKFLASKGDAPLLARGGKDDPQFGNRLTFPPIEPDVAFDDGFRVVLGGTTLVAHVTPGHTAGCTTWTTRIAGKNVVIIGSASIPREYKMTPELRAEYRRTFEILQSLPCDIPLGAHGNFFDLADKMAHKKSFIDPAGYRELIESWERAFATR